MWMLICPFYTTCKYFCDLIKIVYLRAKHRFLDFCKQTLNEQICHMCNKVNTQFCKRKILFHMCNIVRGLSMEYISCELFYISIILRFFRMFKNADQRTYKRMNPWCKCMKQEYQVFHSISDLHHKHNQCECWSVINGYAFLKPTLSI